MKIEDVAIDKTLWEGLKRIESEKKAVEALLDQFVSNCQSRLMHADEKAKEIWLKIQSQYPEVDLKNVHWAPDMREPKIVAIQMKLGPARHGN